MGKETVLFMCTKQFPFPGGESYIELEVPYLAKAFDRVVLIPTDYFGEKETHQRIFPSNVSVIAINKRLNNAGKSRIGGAWRLLRIMIAEFLCVNTRMIFLKNSFWFLNVLRHHIAIANEFEAILNKEFSNSENFFYTYWMHQAAVSLGILKEKKVIRNFVARAHSLDLYQEDWGYLKDLQVPGFKMFKLSHASAIYSVSDHGKDYFLNKYPAWKHKFSRAYLGVADSGLTPIAQDDIFTMVTCSNFSINKRMSSMPDILALLDFPCRWIAFGSGVEQAMIEEKVKKLPHNVKVDLRGDLPNKELLQFYQNNSLHLYINLSIAEGLPVSLMEAASFGIPMIATDVYGNPEVVVNDETGFLVPRDFKPEDVAEKIRMLHNDSLLLARLSAGARKNFLENFQAAVNYPSFADEIKRVHRNV